MAFRHVLVPTDLSEPGNQAVRYAVEEAALHRARLTLLHVLPPDATTDVYYVTGAPDAGARAGLDPVAGGRLGASMGAQPTVVRDDDSEGALTQLRDLAGQALPGTADVEVAVGHPADTIVRIAQERAADLIVMSTHGRTGLQHVLLGSVAEKVVRLAPCPVLTIKYRRD
jgi:nucleotide-binding universal stress UspA family protein